MIAPGTGRTGPDTCRAVSPTLTVVIPAYNVEAFILPAVHSVLSQAYSDLEVIVVDDGSTDGTEGRVREVADHRLRVIRRPNGGLSAARNTGIRAARGKYIALLDADDLWFPGYAATHVSALEADASLGISYNYSAYIDERGEPTGQWLVSSKACPSLRQLVRRNHVGTGDVVVRRECFEEAGYFDERLRACEDIEMWIRVLHRTTYRAGLIPEALSGYRVRHASLTMQFDHHVSNARMAADIIRDEVGISQRQWRRFVAEACRITARKAMSSSQPRDARRLLGEALRLCPWLVVVDLRAAGTLLFVMSGATLPSSVHATLCRAGEALMRVCVAAVFGRRRTVAS